MNTQERLIKAYGYNGAINFIHKKFNSKEESKYKLEENKYQYNQAKKEWFGILDNIVISRMRESVKQK